MSNDNTTDTARRIEAARARTAAAVRARRAGVSSEHYASEIAAAWDDGDEDAFDAPAPE